MGSVFWAVGFLAFYAGCSLEVMLQARLCKILPGPGFESYPSPCESCEGRTGAHYEGPDIYIDVCMYVCIYVHIYIYTHTHHTFGGPYTSH